VVGQSGTERPTPLLVTIPPLQMSKSVAMHVSHAKQLSHFVDLAEFPEFISEKDNRRLRGFRRCVSVAVAQWATQHQLCFHISTALRTAKRLQLRTRRRCRLSWFVLLLRRWIFRFRRAWRRRTLRTRQFGTLFEPRLIILRCIDHQ